MDRDQMEGRDEYLWRRARHEAGHVAAILLLGGRFRVATARVESIGPGFTLGGVDGISGLETPKYLVVTLAGAAIDIIDDPRRHREGSLLALGQQCARYLESNHVVDFREYRRASGRDSVLIDDASAAMELLKPQVGLVEALSNELVMRDLDYDQARAVFEKFNEERGRRR